MPQSPRSTPASRSIRLFVRGGQLRREPQCCPEDQKWIQFIGENAGKRYSHAIRGIWWKDETFQVAEHETPFGQLFCLLRIQRQAVDPQSGELIEPIWCGSVAP